MKFSVEAINLRKVYDKIAVVDGMNFKINKGELVALLGPNGSGKTTTIKMLGGILKPTSGDARVYGYDIKTEAIKIKEKLGVLTEHYSVYESLTARENLELFAELYDVDNPKQKITEILEVFELDKTDKTVNTFSKGMKKKLALARSIFHNPQILFLDEPSSDLDPKSASELRNYLKNLVNKNNLSGIICTHNLYDATELCSRFIIINNGKVLLDGTREDLLRSTKTGICLEVKFVEEKKLLDYVDKNTWLHIVKVDKKSSICKLMVEDNACVNKILGEIPNLEVISFGNTTSQIEQAYIELIRRN